MGSDHPVYTGNVNDGAALVATLNTAANTGGSFETGDYTGWTLGGNYKPLSYGDQTSSAVIAFDATINSFKYSDDGHNGLLIIDPPATARGAMLMPMLAGILGRLSLPGALLSWSLTGLLTVVCIGVIALVRPSSDGRDVRPTTPSSIDAARADPGVQQPLVQAQTAAQAAGPTAAPIAPEPTQWGQTIARELANAEQGIEQLKTSQAQLARDNADLADRLKETQEQMARHDVELAQHLKAVQDEMVRNNLNMTKQLKASQAQIASIGDQLKVRQEQKDRLGAPKQPQRPPKLASPSSRQLNAAPRPKLTPKPAPKPQSPQAGLLPKNSSQWQPTPH
jgi:hypothetical protein